MNMHNFLNFATRRTLFLIDEFGTGTEPQFGGAIAEAILADLMKKKPFGVITTHYTNLKKFAEKTEGVINGAMRFDIGRMEPLFELQIGRPGSSFALEIAGKIGLPDAIIQEAKSGIGTSHVNLERLLGELEQEKKETESQKKKLQGRERELEDLVKEYNHLKTYLEEHKNKILKEAQQEADDLISQANKEIEKTIRLIKEAKADKEKTRLIRQNLERFKEKTVVKGPPVQRNTKEKSSITVIQGIIEEGDFVRIKNQDTVGQVLKIKGSQAEVAIGNLKSNLSLSRLERISASSYKKVTGKSTAGTLRLISSDLNEKLKNFKSTLDLRGKRAEEALNMLDGYLDEAMLLGKNEVRVLHGKGDGILREVIRTHLGQADFIASVHDEDVERGGAGISIILLK
jgi:DNA mismatch repair protein MutS2